MFENEKNLTPKTPNKNVLRILTGVSYLLTLVSILIGITVIPVANIILTPFSKPLPIMILTIGLASIMIYYVMISDEDLEVHGIILLLINFLLFFLLTSVHINIA